MEIDQKLKVNSSSSNINDFNLFSSEMQTTLQHEDDVSAFPFIKPSDSEFMLPRYAEVLHRSAEHGIKMEDLDFLQKDLETLLSICVIRQRILLSEIEPASVKMEGRRDQGNKYHQKQLHLTNKLNEKSNSNTEIIFPNIPERDTPISDTSKVILCENPIAESFWSYVEPYFAEITEDDLDFTDSLIKKSLQDVDVKGIQTPKNIKRHSYSDHYMCKKLKMNSSDVDDHSQIKVQSRCELQEEMEKCIIELTNVRKNNLTVLHTLRTAVKRKVAYNKLRNCYKN